MHTQYALRTHLSIGKLKQRRNYHGVIGIKSGIRMGGRDEFSGVRLEHHHLRNPGIVVHPCLVHNGAESIGHPEVPADNRRIRRVPRPRMKVRRYGDLLSLEVGEEYRVWFPGFGDAEGVEKVGNGENEEPTRIGEME